MKFDKFTLKAQEALATAQQVAMAKSHTILSPLHLLSALLSDEGGVAGPAAADDPLAWWCFLRLSSDERDDFFPTRNFR